MLTHIQRLALDGVTESSDPISNALNKVLSVVLHLNKNIRYDCEGKKIQPGDKIEVVAEDDQRKSLEAYQFCSVGKKGKILYFSPGCNSWIVTVEFVLENGERRTVGCVDYHLRII